MSWNTLCTKLFLLVLYSGFALGQEIDLDSKLVGSSIHTKHHRQLAGSSIHTNHHQQVKSNKVVNFHTSPNIDATSSDGKHRRQSQGNVQGKTIELMVHEGKEKAVENLESEDRPLRPKKSEKRRLRKEKQADQERRWQYCADGRRPINTEDASIDSNEKGHMCRDMYPGATCCHDHDLTMELVGDKMLENMPEMQCARMLMKLRCAHCSPRSWWLFHAPDKIRYPHERVLPILCPGFCKKLHRLCRDTVKGFEGDNFCDFHTSNEEGPCFPDSFVSRGSID